MGGIGMPRSPEVRISRSPSNGRVYVVCSVQQLCIKENPSDMEKKSIAVGN